MMMKIISGGQTGVDTGALEAAHELGIETGGWCPPGCINEAGPIPEHFNLRETETDRSPQTPDLPRSLRTQRNVEEADAVLLLLPEVIDADAGTILTLQLAIMKNKPLLQVDPADDRSMSKVLEWIKRFKPNTLVVAGPPESVAPEIGQLAKAFMTEILDELMQEKTQ